jgi:hypothetical protein
MLPTMGKYWQLFVPYHLISALLLLTFLKRRHCHDRNHLNCLSLKTNKFLIYSLRIVYTDKHKSFVASKRILGSMRTMETAGTVSFQNVKKMLLCPRNQGKYNNCSFIALGVTATNRLTLIVNVIVSKEPMQEQ